MQLESVLVGSGGQFQQALSVLMEAKEAILELTALVAFARAREEGDAGSSCCAANTQWKNKRGAERHQVPHQHHGGDWSRTWRR